MTCADMDSLLAGRVLADLDGAGSSELDQHLVGCPGCRERLARLEAWRHERAELPASRWDELAARIEADRLRPIRVALTCSYCHDAFGRDAATYCAGCLAPHHEDCFVEHGACSTPGCGETRLVRAGRSVRPGRAGRAAWFLAAAVVGSGITVAALRPWRAAPEPPVPEKVAKAPDPVEPRQPPELRVESASIGCVTIRARDANVRDAFEAITSASGKNIVIAPEVHGDISLEMRNVPWKTALESVAQTVGDYEVVEDTPDLYRVVPRSTTSLAPVTRVIHLTHGATVENLDKLVKTAVDQSKVGPNGCSSSWYARDDRSNSFVVTAPAPVIKRLETALQQLDVAAVDSSMQELPKPNR